jgi:hypothetical protein
MMICAEILFGFDFRNWKVIEGLCMALTQLRAVRISGTGQSGRLRDVRFMSGILPNGEIISRCNN